MNDLQGAEYRLLVFSYGAGVGSACQRRACQSAQALCAMHTIPPYGALHRPLPNPLCAGWFMAAVHVLTSQQPWQWEVGMGPACAATLFLRPALRRM